MENREKGLYQLIQNTPDYPKIRQALKDKENVLISGLTDPFQDYLAAALSSQMDQPLIILAPNEVSARNIIENMTFLYPQEAVLFPAKDPMFYSAEVRGDAVEEKRLKALLQIREEKARIVVMSVEACFDRLMPKEVFESMIIRKKVGEDLELENLSRDLVRRGYDRRDQVEHAGQFAIRGGIVDIYPMTASQATRVELWGDTIDSIRILNAETQRSEGNLEEVVIDPAREIILNEQRFLEGTEKIRKEVESTEKRFRKAGNEEAAHRVKEVADSLFYRLETVNSTALDPWIPFFYPDNETILDYLPSDSILILKEPAHIQEKVKAFTAESAQSVAGRLERGYLMPTQAAIFPDFSELMVRMESFPVLSVCSILSAGQEMLKARHLLHMSTRSMNVLTNMPEEYLKDLRLRLEEKYSVVLLCESKLRLNNLLEGLTQAALPVIALKKDQVPPEGVVSLCIGTMKSGFLWTEGKLLIAPQQSSSRGEKKKRSRSSFKNGQKIGSFNDLMVGDYVVHETHGVGIYKGITQIERDGTSRDYFMLSYADGGNLYVPITSLDLLQKYIGGEDAKPKINRLGGQEWNRTKSKVRASVKKLAEELIRVYAMRQEGRGYAFSEDTIWQKEFEDAFPYQETDDQLSAIQDTKKDMESSRIMDRLICGDVGYGKTEVAIRAAFKAVEDGKQVAMLAPTTILAQQHYNTFTQRLKDYPMTVGLLSRFRSPLQIKETLKGLANGSVDIVIGTHRLLSKDVFYKDLGLLIVDEEQRFGVTHKDRIKEIQQKVDVLTLTATPIPRTLHMSLSGIRDMSVLEEPPQERQPIQTFVIEEDDELIREAIYREMGRNGQVFFLYNRVRGIDEQVLKLQKMVPEARISFAHGQMSKRELENIMMQFIEGEVDVLVCTTIIETGLDIPNANTIIIADADHMGLAQLYQLRGRVGRSDRLAYAYFMFRKDKVLQEEAQKRLEAIGEFTEFGSGFRIAMRDLQIRGAGNLLGAEQHGHMGAVGYELYCKMLREAMESMNKNNPVEENYETTIHLDVNAYIPDSYIPVESQKLEVYKKIALISDYEDYLDVQDELMDRFSEMPAPVGNLMDISYIKTLARRLGIDLIDENIDRLQLHFRQGAPIDPVILFEKTKIWPRAKLTSKDMTATLVIPFPAGKKEKDAKRIERVRKDLEALLPIIKTEKESQTVSEK